MDRTRAAFVALCLASAFVASAACSPVVPSGVFECSAESEPCAAGYVCSPRGFCCAAGDTTTAGCGSEADAGPLLDAGEPDAGEPDAGARDAGLDAGVDAGPLDAGPDAGADAGADAGCPAGREPIGGACVWDLGLDVGWTPGPSCADARPLEVGSGDTLRARGVDLRRSIRLCFTFSASDADGALEVGGSPLAAGVLEDVWTLDALPSNARHNELTVLVSDAGDPGRAGRSYTLVADRVVESLSASSVGAAFGDSVAISADGSVLAVGAPNGGTAEAGAVVVFPRAPNGAVDFGAGAPLTWGDTEPGAHFGASIALDGDGTVLVVGAPQFGSDGGAFVFRRASPSGAWDAGTSLTLPADSEAEADQLGASVDVSDDGQTIVVGAPHRNVGATGQRGEFGIWLLDAGGDYVENDRRNRVRPDGFSRRGISVALSGDGRTLVVGADNDNPAGADRPGRVWIYERSADPGAAVQFRFEAHLEHPAPTATDRFGRAVAVSADGSTVAIANRGTSRMGLVRIYERSASGSWATPGASPVTVSSPNRAAGDGDEFGRALALSADGLTLVVGAPFEDGANDGIDPEDPEAPFSACSGATFVWRRSDGASAFSQPFYLKVPSTGGGTAPSTTCPGPGAQLGSSVALSSDGQRVVSGAPWPSEQGAAHVYE